MLFRSVALFFAGAALFSTASAASAASTASTASAASAAEPADLIVTRAHFSDRRTQVQLLN